MARIEFAEAGAVVLERLWWRRIGAMSATITDRLRLSGRGTVSAGDMTQLPLADNSVDVVVWDPPFYDNIDYDLLAAPWTAFLRVVIGELHPQLPWPDVRLSPDWHPSEFDKAAYENSLVEAASEVARVCRPGGRCGVFWISRSADELQRFIDLVQPHGMELLQTASLRTEVGARQDSDRPTTYVLVFAVARQSHPPRGSQVRAGRLLELGSSGQQSLNAGIAEILERNWVAEDIGAHFSRQVDGNLSQRLAEYVASLPDPTELLRELGTKVLREEAVRLAIGRSDLNGLDALGIARRIMECLGFTVPSAPYFSIGSALQQAEQAHSRIVFGASIEEVKGSGLAACEQIEHVLRFCVTAWTSRAGGDAWETLVEEAYEGQTYPGVGRLSFGDWTALVTTIVRKLSKENQQFERVRRQFKSRGLTEALQGAVWSRNRLAHTEPGRDWAELKRMAASKIGQALKVLRILIDGGALPIVLQPVEEIRDRFSRYRVRLLDHNERQVELIAPGPIDLTEPVIWFTAGLPREVEPDLLSATVVEIRMGLRPDI